MSGGDRGPEALRGLYQEIILAHYRRPRNRGKLEEADATIEMNNPTCGDEVALWLRFGENRAVGEIAFGGHGCSISQASASMMTELVRGRSREDIAALAARFRDLLHGDADAASDRMLGDARALAGVAKFPARVRCAMLPWAALEDVLRREARGGDGATG